MIHFNGINGATGEYLQGPMEVGAFLKLIRRTRIAPVPRFRGLKAGVACDDLAEAGWGVIFPHDVEAAVREAVSRLVEYRRGQAAAKDLRCFRELIYEPGDSKSRFLVRNGTTAGPVDPKKVPYYLLIVGDPRQIPYSFQYELDVQYAVGRICFESPESYAEYARQVIEAETTEPPSSRRLALFGVRNQDDPLTALSTDHLIRPLARILDRDCPRFEVETHLAESATRARLSELLAGQDPPRLLLSASHALWFPKGHRRQLAEQGALLCYDWPGPQNWRREIPAGHCFGSQDVSSRADLRGLVAFFFACYSAGTPELDSFALPGPARPAIAPHPFAAQLPQRLLERGALAVIGHVDRACLPSFWSQVTGSQVQVFESTLKKLLDGAPVGLAMEDFGQRHAELSVDLQGLASLPQEVDALPEEEQREWASLWKAYNDARGYVVFGDPAVRLTAS